MLIPHLVLGTARLYYQLYYERYTSLNGIGACTFGLVYTQVGCISQYSQVGLLPR